VVAACNILPACNDYYLYYRAVCGFTFCRFSLHADTADWLCCGFAVVGCACCQGYLLGRPAGAREFTEMALELGGL